MVLGYINTNQCPTIAITMKKLQLTSRFSIVLKAENITIKLVPNIIMFRISRLFDSLLTDFSFIIVMVG